MQEKIIATNVSLASNSTTHIVKIALSVSSNNSSSIDSKHGPYNITFEPSLLNAWNTAWMNTVNGALIYNLIVFNDGIFNMTISSPGLLSTIIYFTTLTKIAIIPDSLYYSDAWIQLPVNINNEHGKLFNSSVILSIQCQNASAQSSQISTSNGTATFYLLFPNSGNNNCAISALGTSVIQNITLNIKHWINPDPKCIIPASPTTCINCIDKATVNNIGTCVCNSLSVYNNETTECQCLPEYAGNNATCYPCMNYFSPSDINAYYSEDYLSIIIEFAKEISQSHYLSNCNGMFQLPLTLMNNNPECIWQNFKTMKIIFDAPVSGQIINVTLNSSLVTTKNGNCSFNMQALNIEVMQVYPLPVPYTGINAPMDYSLQCNSNSFYVSAALPSINTDNLYTWSSIITPPNSALLAFISAQTTSSYQIDYSLLQVGQIEFLLTVSSSTFGTSASAETTVTFTNQTNLLVGFDSGYQATMRSQDKRAFKVIVLQNCGANDSYQYTWSYSQSSSTPALNFAGLLKKNLRTDTLVIYPGFLTSGITYQFTVNVTSGSITGGATLNIKMILDPLTLTISRTDGTVGNFSNFVVSAQASDPDNSNAALSITWTCVEEGASCLNSKNALLFSPTSGSILTIPDSSLRNGALYSIIATASTSTKSANAKVNINIDLSTKGCVNSINVPQNINTNLPLTVTANIYLTGNASFLWSFTPPGNSWVSLTLNNSYLIIPANYLNPGTEYNLMLTLFFTPSGYASGSVNIVTRSIPVCDSFTSVSSNNKWTLTGVNCQDANDDILIYQFGTINNQGKTSWISIGSYSNTIAVRLLRSTSSVILNVCNSIGMCSQYTDSINLLGRNRRLSTLTDFESDILDSDLIPSSIIYYSPLITDQNTYDYMYNAMYNYYSTIIIDKPSLGSLIDCATAMLANSSFVLSGSYQTETTQLLTLSVNNYANSLQFSEVSAILDMLDPYCYTIDPNSLVNLLQALGSSWLGQSPINTILQYNNTINLSSYRLLGSSIANSSLTIGTNIIQIPSNLPLINSTIYDIVVFQFNSSNIYFEIAFYISGSYNYYSLILAAPVQTVIFPIFPISLNSSGNYDASKSYECLLQINDTLDSGSCSIKALTNSYVIVTITNESLFIIRPKINTTCDIGSGPIVTMFLMIILWIGLSILFLYFDKDIKTFNSEFSLCLFYHPITGLLNKQPNRRRAAIITHITACELLLLTLIGIMYDQFDNPKYPFSATFHDFYGSQMSRGASAWFLCQVFAIPIFIANAYSISKSHILKTTLPICILFIVLSFIAVIIMTSKYCSGYTIFWIINFLIFLLLDLFILQAIYAILFTKFINQSIPASISIDKNGSPGNETARLNIDKRPTNNEVGGLDDNSIAVEKKEAHKNSVTESTPEIIVGSNYKDINNIF